MDTRKLKAQAYSFPTEGVGIFDEASTEIASCNKLEEAEELVKRFNAYPQLHGMLSALYESGLQTGSYPSQASLGAVHDWYETQVAGATPSSSGDPFTVMAQLDDPEADGHGDVYCARTFGANAKDAAVFAVDALIKERGLDPPSEELAAWRDKYYVFAVFPGHHQNAITPPSAQ